MRRKEKAITEKREIEQILREAEVCRLAMCDGDIPYIVPLNFGYKEDCLYFHSAKEGRKLEILKKNPLVCFEAESGVQVQEGTSPCNWDAKYKSVIGLGKVVFLEQPEEVKEALDTILEKYSGRRDHTYQDSALARVQVLRVDIEQISGKKEGY